MIKLFLATFLVPAVALAALTDFDRQDITPQNPLASFNSGFESGIAQVTGVGVSPVAVTSGSNLLTGKGSITWDSTAAAQTLTGKAIIVPNGLKGKNCELALDSVMTPSGTATHTFSAWDGSNTLASVPIVSSVNPVQASVNFPCPTSGTIAWRLTSVASNEPLIAIDDGYFGRARNVGSVSQATEYGSLSYSGTAGCQWTTTSTSFANFAADTDCPTASVTGNATAPGTKIPGITFPSLPPGDYYAVVQATLADNTGDGNACYFQISDGSTTNGHTQLFTSGVVNHHGGIGARFSYSTGQGSTTFQVRGASDNAGNTCDIINAVGNNRFGISVFRYPSSAEQAFRPDAIASSWSGYHDSTCSWARTNSAYGDPTVDATCDLVQRQNQNFGTVSPALSGGDDLPGIVFTPVKSGKYLACVNAYGAPNITAVGATIGAQLTDGSVVVSESVQTGLVSASYQLLSNCSIYNVASVAPVTLKIQTKASLGQITIGGNGGSAIEWAIYDISFNSAAPLLVGSVTSSSAGLERIERTKVTCSSSSSITNQSDSWVTSIANISSGTCDLTIDSSKWSAAPTCITTGDIDNTAVFAKTRSTSTSMVQIFAYNSVTNTAPTSYTAQIICTGSR